MNNYEREVKEPAAHEVAALTIITSSFQNPPAGTQKEKGVANAQALNYEGTAKGES